MANDTKANAKRNNGGWPPSSPAGLLAGSVKYDWSAKKTDDHDMSLFLMNMAAIGNVWETMEDASVLGLATWWT